MQGTGSLESGGDSDKLIELTLEGEFENSKFLEESNDRGGSPRSTFNEPSSPRFDEPLGSYSCWKAEQKARKNSLVMEHNFFAAVPTI